MYRKNPFKGRIQNSVGNAMDRLGEAIIAILSVTGVVLFMAGAVGLPVLIAIALIKYIFQ